MSRLRSHGGGPGVLDWVPMPRHGAGSAATPGHHPVCSRSPPYQQQRRYVVPYADTWGRRMTAPHSRQQVTIRAGILAPPLAPQTDAFPGAGWRVMVLLLSVRGNLLRECPNSYAGVAGSSPALLLPEAPRSHWVAGLLLAVPQALVSPGTTSGTTRPPSFRISSCGDLLPVVPLFSVRLKTDLAGLLCTPAAA